MNVLYADTCWNRLVGMLFGRGSQQGECLVLRPCCDVHTMGMRWPLDIAFVSKAGVVLSTARKVPPFRRLSCKGAFAAVERKACEGVWLEPGQQVMWAVEGCGTKRKTRPKAR